MNGGSRDAWRNSRLTENPSRRANWACAVTLSRYPWGMQDANGLSKSQFVELLVNRDQEITKRDDVIRQLEG